ncbi:MAG: hypothetical protein U0271_23465 [Polyangiaceae bacterium]
MAWSRWLQGGIGVVSVAGVATLLATSSCAEAEGRFYILSMDSAAVLCGSTSASCDGTEFISRGQFDKSGCAGNCQYGVVVTLHNEMTSSLESQANHNDVETSRIIISSYDISYSNGSPSLSNVAWNGSIEPEGFTCGGLVLLDSAAVDAALGEVIVTVKFYGRTTGGLDVETPEYSFSVTVTDDGCNGTVICTDPNDTSADENCQQGLDGHPLTCAVCPNATACADCNP